jgi:hypothetical protein
MSLGSCIRASAFFGEFTQGLPFLTRKAHRRILFSERDLMHRNPVKAPERTVDVAEFKRNPAATARRAREEGPVAVMKLGKVLLVVSVPKPPPLDTTI